MHNTIEPQTETPKRYQCRHIFTDGHRCGSPCLRSEHLCYYHHTTRKPAPHPRTRQARRSTFEIPLPEDRSAIQHAIGKVLQRIAELGTLAPPAEVGKGAQRKSAVTLLIEKLLEGDEQKQQEPTTIPTLQATEDDATHPDPCNIPTPAVTLSPACRAATHLRSLPSAIGATRRPAESSHASLKTPKQLQSLRTSRAAA